MIKDSPLYRIRRNWQVRIWLKAVSWVLLALMAGLVMVDWLQLPIWSIGILAIFMVYLVRAEIRRSPKEDELTFAINKQIPEAQFSSEMILHKHSDRLSRIQENRVRNALESSWSSFKYPVSFLDIIIAGVFVLLIFTASKLIPSNPNLSSDRLENDLRKDFVSAMDIQDTVFIKDVNVGVSPPKYTGMNYQSSHALNQRVPESSRVFWSLEFEGSPNSVWIKFSNGDSISFSQTDKVWKTSSRISESGIYSIFFLDGENEISTPYYQLFSVSDAPPSVAIEGIPQFQKLDFTPDLSLNFDVSFSDNYQLTDAYLVATITKGSGESVKFREEQIKLPKPVYGKSMTQKVELPISDFGLEPGNEFYFYATAFDNHVPEAQQTRTETYFYVLEDTSEVVFSLQGALGIDLMPEYFRSQLQIILDTEKLIKEKEVTSKEDFNFESNALGFDQKQLRLKYGQFIGEEEDSGLEIDEEPEEVVEIEDAEGALAEFGHDTDEENEEGEWMDNGSETNNPLAAYMHNHGDEETATFYTVSLKSKLKAALNEMWDAELYLRLFQPEKSLPYQCRAQKLLKEIRNHARIYVQRIGFDPPSVNESESRLSGKLKELNELPFSSDFAKEDSLPQIKDAIVRIDRIMIDETWTIGDRKALEAAGEEFAELTLENPVEYLDALNVLKMLIEVEVLEAEDLKALKAVKQVLEGALPDEVVTPGIEFWDQNQLNRLFIERMTNP